jgi:hemolysin activation/secretion protein
VALACLLVGAHAIAQEVGIPESDRPGAARPEPGEATTAQQAPTTEVLEVPAVIDRPFEIDEGDRVAVKEFRLLDAADLPEYDISLAEIQKILQDIIIQKPEGFTIGQLVEAASAVTNYYRERQLILAQAVVPVQTVENGVVSIQVMPGMLGRVLTEGNEMYSEKLLTGPFKKLVGKPVTKDAIESALLSLTDFPGLTVFGVFQPGIQVGTADIVLNVQDEKRFDMAYRVDDHGVAETGRFRFRPSIQWNNPTGSADRLSLLLQQTYQPKNNIFYSTRYNRYLGRGFNAELFWDQNAFDVGGELKTSQIHGETRNVGGSVFKNWIRSRTFNLYSNVDFTLKESITTTRGNPTNRDKLTVLALGANFDHVDTRFRGINSGSIEYSRGFNDLFGAMAGSAHADELRPAGTAPSVEGRTLRIPQPDGSTLLVPQFAEGQFNKFYATLERLQTVTPDLTLQLRAEYQWTDDLLVPMEQYTVGGPDNLRAYPQGQHLLDRAVYASAEFIHNVPFITDRQAFGNRTWGELLQISVFYDFVRGRLVRPFAEEDEGYRTFMGAGVSAIFNLPGSIESKFITAWDIDINDFEETSPDNDKKPQIWGELTYRF